MRRLLLVLAAALATALPARAQSIQAGPGTELSSLIGRSLNVPFVVDMSGRPEKLGAFAMRIAWNPAVLRFENGLPGTFGSVTVNGDSITQGVIRLAGANPAGAGGLVTVAVSRFTPLLADTTTIQVALTELFAAGSFADLLPSATVRSGLYCPARGRYGDVDQDGNANSRDALIALSNAVGLGVSQFDISLGDVDADGNANARDALIILSAAVGLDVSAYRVLALAGGACTSGPPVVFAVAPGVVGDVAIGQAVQFEARAVGGTGAAQAVSAQWLVSNPAVLGILATGLAVARDTGLADVIAVRDGRDTARVSVHVVARRGTWTVEAAAIGAANQLGSPSLPFATLDQAAAAIGPRDTVVVRPGRYDGSVFNVPVVLLGQRSGGAGAVIASNGGSDGLTLDGSGVSEVHDLAIEGFDVGLRLGNNADTVIADSLRVFASRQQGSCATAIRSDDAWALIVRRSQIAGDGPNGCTTGIELYGNVHLVVIEDTRITDLGGGETGLYGNNVDSVVVRRSQFSDINDYVIRLRAYAYSGGGRVPAASSVALVVDSSRFLRNGYEDIRADGLRSAVITHTVIDTRGHYGNPLNLYGVDSAYVRLVGDSILLDHDQPYNSTNSWFNGDGFDSVTVDSTRAVGASCGYMGGGVDYVRVRNSSFTESGSSYYCNYYVSPPALLYVSPNRLPTATIVVDSVTATGVSSSSCSQCMDFIRADSARVTVNRLRLDNFDTGIYSGDSSVTVTNSAFTNGYDAIEAYSSSSAPQRLVVRNVAFTDVEYPIYSGDYVSLVDSVTITRGYDAIYLYGAGADTVRNATLIDVSSYGIDVEDAPSQVAGNVIVRSPYQAIYAYGSGLAGDTTVIVNNTITCVGSGADGIAAYYGHSRIAGNIISGCSEGVLVSGGQAGFSTEIRGNAVTVPLDGYAGIETGRLYRVRVTGNTVVGGGRSGSPGGIYVHGNSTFQPEPYALVDSNTVRQTLAWGIRAEYVDSLEIRGNLVEDAAEPAGCYYYECPYLGAIALRDNFLYSARVVGNAIRRPRSNGIVVDQLDTATVFVDSNAVSVADSVAVRLFNGRFDLQGNNIRNNRGDGVRLETYGGPHEMHGNAFKGNGGYAANDNYGESTTNADGNWWGADGQPPGGPGADSARGIYDNAPLASEPTGLPPLAPPAGIMATRPVASALPAASSVQAAVVPVGTSPGRHPTRAERLAQREAWLRTASLRAPTAAAAPAGGRQPRPVSAREQAQTARAIERVGAQIRAEAVRAAERAARDSVRAERRSRPEQAREVRP